MYMHNFIVYFTELDMEAEPITLFRTKMFCFLLQNSSVALLKFCGSHMEVQRFGTESFCFTTLQKWCKRLLKEICEIDQILDKKSLEEIVKVTS